MSQAAVSVELDRTSPVPLYYQLAQALEQSILDGRLVPGDRIENEIDLAKRLSLSRPTARQAIQALVDKGLLVRKRGVGTQVVRNEVHRAVELTSLYEDLVAAGQRPSTVLLDYRLGRADEEVADELGIEHDAQVVSIRRLRSADDVPLAILTNHLPAELAPAPDELQAKGLYQCLRGRGITIAHAQQRIGARISAGDEADLLDEQPGEAVLTMQRVAFNEVGTAIELGRHVYRASRYFFDVSVFSR
ncbi:Transcriptional regulator, GntR family OS=Tsukamurella paurometabola (strain ATCC 8368 / DSM/ CCUG 35730 / CIP 100753 / JCM 10117 / KCTC 9821 / NBRC 16120/ NCIMB 702349 / NCTC 13040) OX=521096 GN=Tpau_1364 PE=4 SV=1 [Tsukamurella paurometabola]|uniref:Transcriptional regulator, GntR family n=1 Tax=Tsukamurella paurometabola (strain ATCC 8368 / DSM 20162 / CCUG 35730 / CIP 100753 / JCM 10117 / KCTC 9821 / NBRC 16120 / NCIMB 702349 / NCTC 13040) TaxID=521096 RepID=D5UWX0_TSUPD|nr:GntR family transcriptional regulator [Tsukamurella paurometabola]ADG77992.1 transcriptional regulator, GntR family [Tsukamurella paurometabola DSM 20162]SUP29688.1 HTH-type transcriptional repressor yvoA [Tsukamurella paurometabola]